MNTNENTTHQNFWKAVIAVLRGKFIALNVYIRKAKRKSLNQYPKLPPQESGEAQNESTPRRSEIIKIIAEINEFETEKQYRKLIK